MIEVEVINGTKSNQYPLLMKSKVNGIIVLFKNHKKGFIISGNDIGGYMFNWDMNEFEPFDGEVVLRNKR